LTRGYDVGPGEGVPDPACLPVGEWPATALLIVTPGGLDESFAELSAALAANADTAQVRTIQRAYGIVRS
jgi:hypothetical protein